MVESDARYYRRRACEEMGAANRAVTEAARTRRLQLVDVYLQRLAALNEPNACDAHEFARARGRPSASGTAKGRADPRSAFAWPGSVDGQANLERGVKKGPSRGTALPQTLARNTTQSD